mgnify:CR=1 FL=1
MSLNQIVTPLDSATLETKEQYVFYHHIVTHAIDVVLKGLETHSLCNTQEVVLIKQYMKLFLYSLEMMRVKYKYDEEHHMKIDVTESGFPNYLEFRYLINDLALRNEHINRLPKVEELKEKFLDTLLKDKTHISEHQLFQAASIVYYSDVEEHISAARRSYNAASRRFKDAIQIFPGSVIAKMMGLETLPFFEVTEAERAPVDADQFFKS